MLAKRCAVLIKKGLRTETSRVIFEHEIPVLEFKYGPVNITRTTIPRTVYKGDNKPQVERGPLRFVIQEIDHDEEYNRLMNTYGKHMDQDKFVCEMAYGYVMEKKMEQLNELKYRPLVIAGHAFVPAPVPQEEDFDDGLGEIFDEVPKSKRAEVEKKMVDTMPQAESIKDDSFMTQEEADGQLPPHSESPHVTEKQAQEASATKETPEPLADIDTMFKIENMTVAGIKDMLTEREIPHNPEDSKSNLHKKFMDSMNPVGVEIDEED